MRLGTDDFENAIKMTRTAKNEIDELRRQIRHHDRKYYVEASPEISDLDYDRLMQRLTSLEEAHPELVTPDSPTQRIGDQPVDHLTQFEHAIPMLSIENTYDEESLRQFGLRTDELLEGAKAEWVVELKIDGVAASVIYENGLLVRAATRGDGRVGDDITHNIRTVQDVPLRLLTEDPPELLEVRGEVYMTNSELVRLNKHQQEAGDKITRTREMWRPEVFACSTRANVPSEICGCSATERDNAKAWTSTVTWIFWPRLVGLACRRRRWSSA